MIELYENVFLTDLDSEDENYYLVVKGADDEHTADFIERDDERRAFLYLDHYNAINFEPNLLIECAMFFIRRGIDAERKVFIVTEDESNNCIKLGFLFEMCNNNYSDDEIQSRLNDYFKKIGIIPFCNANEFVIANRRVGGSLWRE